MCSVETGVYINGHLTCHLSGKMKFLSYQPPGGGWNNQRFAFENAVVIAKLLNRTLVVHPIAPHDEIRLAMRARTKALEGYDAYNSISSEKLLPLSRAIDLKHLSRLLPVKEFTKNHKTFYNTFRGSDFFRVCHNAFLGLWVDEYPPKEATVSWNILRKYTAYHRRNISSIPSYRRWCNAELDSYADKVHDDRPLWGILDELAHRSEDMIYFAEGSLYIRDIIFLDKQRALAAHEWIMRYIRSAPALQTRARLVARQIGRPFHAVHVRRGDHPSKQLVSQQTWLAQLDEKRARRVTRKLYVATDERNKTWFKPFIEGGYQLFFAEDFASILQPDHVTAPFAQDLLGLHEQLICTHAFHFVGSYYSTFTRFIERLRRQTAWKGGFLEKSMSSFIWVDYIKD